MCRFNGFFSRRTPLRRQRVPPLARASHLKVRGMVSSARADWSHLQLCRLEGHSQCKPTPRPDWGRLRPGTVTARAQQTHTSRDPTTCWSGDGYMSRETRQCLTRSSLDPQTHTSRDTTTCLGDGYMSQSAVSLHTSQCIEVAHMHPWQRARDPRTPPLVTQRLSLVPRSQPTHSS